MTLRKPSREQMHHIGVNVFNILAPILLAFAIGAVIIGFMGENPFSVYGILFQKSLFSTKGLLRTLNAAAPLILTGLGIAITFKAGIFNMGVEGSAVLGGLAACIVGIKLHVDSAFLHITLCLLAGIVVGTLYSVIPALLKAFLKVDEMVITLMLNYAVLLIVEYLVSGVFRDPSLGTVSTPVIDTTAMFPKFGDTSMTGFLFIALAVLAVMFVVFKKTKLGYGITAIGKNPGFAEGTGLRVRRKIITIMLISGALGGLAGAGWLTSDQLKFTMGFSGKPGLGWDGMLIALVGMHSPIGVLFGALFFAALKVGAQSISINTEVPSEIITIIQSMIILFFAIKFLKEKTTFFQSVARFFKKLFGKKQAVAVAAGIDETPSVDPPLPKTDRTVDPPKPKADSTVDPPIQKQAQAQAAKEAAAVKDTTTPKTPKPPQASQPKSTGGAKQATAVKDKAPQASATAQKQKSKGAEDGSKDAKAPKQKNEEGKTE